MVAAREKSERRNEARSEAREEQREGREGREGQEGHRESTTSEQLAGAMAEVSAELDVLESQLAYETQVERLLSALDEGAILSCDVNVRLVNVEVLDETIQEAAACGYEAPSFHTLLNACRLTRDLRAGLRAMDVPSLLASLKRSRGCLCFFYIFLFFRLFWLF